MKKKIYNTCSTAGDMSPVPQIEGTKIEINTIMIEEKKIPMVIFTVEIVFSCRIKTWHPVSCQVGISTLKAQNMF